MGRRRKKKHFDTEVELNLAAMLDMAFQLLAFFILTFKPAPVEGYIALRMPPPQATTKPGGASTADSNPVDMGEKLETLLVTIKSGAAGGIASMQIEEGAPTNDLAAFQKSLNELLGAPGAPFEQVILQIGSGLHYDSLVRILDICSRVKLASGEQLTKLSITELPEQVPDAPLETTPE